MSCGVTDSELCFRKVNRDVSGCSEWRGGRETSYSVVPSGKGSTHGL